MRRILTVVLASSLLALALPVAASAHHGSRHAQRAQARKHHRRHHAHMVVFAPKAAPSGPTTTTGTSGTETPTTPTEPVATVASFEGGVLKITLPDGSTVSGKVTEATEIECGCEHQGSQGEQQGFGHDGSGDFGHESGSGDSGHESASGNSGPGSFQHDDEQGQQTETESSCGTASLVPGAKIKEAELNVSSAGAVWDKIELLPKS